MLECVACNLFYTFIIILVVVAVGVVGIAGRSFVRRRRRFSFPIHFE